MQLLRGLDRGYKVPNFLVRVRVAGAEKVLVCRACWDEGWSRGDFKLFTLSRAFGELFSGGVQYKVPSISQFCIGERERGRL